MSVVQNMSFKFQIRIVIKYEMLSIKENMKTSRIMFDGKMGIFQVLQF